MESRWLWGVVAVVALATGGYVYATSAMSADAAETCKAVVGTCSK